jgi:hypothetical protein
LCAATDRSLFHFWGNSQWTKPTNRQFRWRIAGAGRESLPVEMAPGINDLLYENGAPPPGNTPFWIG